MSKEKRHFYIDAAIVSLSVLIAIILGKTGAISWALRQFDGYNYAASFLAGALFTSAFTSAPATVALGVAARVTPPWSVALFGTTGAMLGDLFLFRFIKSHISRDLDYLLKEVKWEERHLTLHHHFLKLKAFKWFFPALGALVIASPLPDELGLMILGLAKVKARWVAPLTFALNFFGILAIGYIARTIH